MIDFLISVVQGACLMAYVYGAWLVITHRPDASPGCAVTQPPAADDRSGDRIALPRNLAYDA